jgi:hypothetical protein
MNFYLIKRGHFEEKIDYNKIEGLDSIIDWDYMGSSEFEWGAPRESLLRMIKMYYNHNFNSTEIMINNKKFIIWFNYDYTKNNTNNIQQIIDFFTASINDPYYGRLQELLNFNEYWKGKEKIIVPGKGKMKAKKEYNYFYANFWWDIINDFFIYPDENNNDKIVNYAIKAYEKRGFGKE